MTKQVIDIVKEEFAKVAKAYPRSVMPRREEFSALDLVGLMNVIIHRIADEIGYPEPELGERKEGFGVMIQTGPKEFQGGIAGPYRCLEQALEITPSPFGPDQQHFIVHFLANEEDRPIRKWSTVRNRWEECCPQDCDYQTQPCHSETCEHYQQDRCGGTNWIPDADGGDGGHYCPEELAEEY